MAGESKEVKEFDWRLDEPSLAAFGGALNPLAPGMIAVATLAGTYAKPDHSRREIVIDKQALLAAIWNYAPRSNVNAAISLVSGLHNQKVMINQILVIAHRARPPELVELYDKKYAVVTSDSLRKRLIPIARTIAQLTVKRDLIDLRHMVMALLYEPADIQAIANSPIYHEMLRSLRAEIVTPLETSRERGESITVWRKLIDKTPAAVEAEMAKGEIAVEAQPETGIEPGEAAPQEGEAEMASGGKTSPPPPNEAIKLQLGDPARVDLLDRKPFADVLGDRINEIYALQRGARGKGDDQAYIIHLHGPWGSGKSTILNFLRDRLRHGWLVQDQPGWLVVDFNAWKYQRLKPAWWALMMQIQQAAERQSVLLFDRFDLKWRWLWLRFRLGALSKQLGPMLICIALIALIYAWLGTGNISQRANTNQTAQASQTAAKDVGDATAKTSAVVTGLAAKASQTADKPDAHDTTLKVLAAIIAAVSGAFGIFNVVKTVTAKPETVTKAHAELVADPYIKVITQFEALIARIRKPIIVFIDDLDRCDAAYVGDLLDNIQTMLRSAPIVYLVAADRAWITTSFGKRYGDFTSHSENSARPLGYLFLDKLFQLSVNMPSLSGPVRTRFLNAILGSAGAALPTPEVVAAATEAAAIEVSEIDSQEELLAKVDDIKEETPEKQAMRVAVARRLGQTDVKAQTEHRLSHLAGLIEPNPRSMKNLVSAVAINQSRLVLEGRSFELDHLARWTIIELRWPLLADWLSQKHERIAGDVETDEAEDPVTKAMRKLMIASDVTAVIKDHLTPDRLSNLIG